MEERLSTLVGVRPSRSWLSACLEHLRQHPTHHSIRSSVDDDGDQILHQILHTDLRNVVRNFRHQDFDRVNGEDDRDDRHTSSSSTLLRRSVSQSSRILNEPQTAANNRDRPRKVLLPESFCHMVQVEELLDISVNAEQRLIHGPASNHSPAPVGNQSKRCLKLLLSDGFYGDGTRFNSVANTNNDIRRTPLNNLNITSIVAMETEPIQDLSVNSKPGIKMVLRGPITIQAGVLMLNPGNTVILGGCIPYLVPIQKKVLEQAKKVAGTGVDPTIRALIGNSEDATEEVDEGEHESSDVQAQPQRIQNTTNESNNNNTRTVPQGNKRQRSEVVNVDTIHDMNVSSRDVAMDTTTINPTPSSQIISQPTIFPSIPTNRKTLSSSQNQTPQELLVPKNHSSIGTTTTTINSTPPNQNIIHPALSPSMPTNNSTNNNNLNSNQGQPSQERPKNHINHHSPNGATSTNVISISTPTPIVSINNTNNDLSAHNTIMQGLSQGSASRKGQDEGNHNTTPVCFNGNDKDLSSAVTTEPLSYLELRSLLEKLIRDKSRYEKYIDSIFVVPCKMKEPMDFNIAKQRKHEKKSKYGYTLSCKMDGPNAKGTTITCMLDNKIVEPFMGMPAADMRKLKRKDKERCSKIVGDRGYEVISTLDKLASFKLKLYHRTSTFFSEDEESPFKECTRCLDGKVPILLVIDRMPK